MTVPIGDLVELLWILVLALGGWLLVEAFVREYSARGVPVQPWYPQETSRGSAGVALAVFLAILLAVGMALRARGVPFPARLAVTGMTAFLLTIAVVDLAIRCVPNRLVGALALVGGLTAVAVLGVPLSRVLLGALVGGATLLAIAVLGRGAMGMGDVKLAAALGALVGFPDVLPALAVGMVAGGIAALVLLITRRVGRKDYMAYAPYLALGAWVILLVRVW